MSSFLAGFSWSFVRIALAHKGGWNDIWNEKREVKVTLHQRYRRVIASFIITVFINCLDRT